MVFTHRREPPAIEQRVRDALHVPQEQRRWQHQHAGSATSEEPPPVQQAHDRHEEEEEDEEEDERGTCRMAVVMTTVGNPQHVQHTGVWRTVGPHRSPKPLHIQLPPIPGHTWMFGPNACDTARLRLRPDPSSSVWPLTRIIMLLHLLHTAFLFMRGALGHLFLVGTLLWDPLIALFPAARLAPVSPDTEVRAVVVTLMGLYIASFVPFLLILVQYRIWQQNTLGFHRLSPAHIVCINILVMHTMYAALDLGLRTSAYVVCALPTGVLVVALCVSTAVHAAHFAIDAAEYYCQRTPNRYAEQLRCILSWDMIYVQKSSVSLR